MKRVKGLWPQVTSFANLLAAHGKARRGKRQREEVARFELNMERELMGLMAELIERRYQPGRYREFTIYDRKPRQIAAAPYRDRVVHHALMRVVEPALDRRFIAACHACRVGHGVHAAVARYQHWAQRYAYAMKLDVVRYFPSIDHARLKAKLARRSGDQHVLHLFDVIIDSAPPVPVAPLPGEDLIDAMARRSGLPIGNLTSQFLGNVYLDDLDHHLQETLRVPAYLRYVDDLIVLHDSKVALREIADEIAHWLTRDFMRLHERKRQIVPTASGLDVLGYHVWPTRRRLRPANGLRFRRRLRAMARAYHDGRLALADITPRVASWVGHALHADTAGLRRALFDEVVFSKGGDERTVARGSRRFVEQPTAELAVGEPQQERLR